MFEKYFLFLFLAHIIGDFYAQTDYMARAKKKHFPLLLMHCLCYWAVFLILSIPIMSWPVLLFGGIAAVAHMAIDVLKHLYVSAKIKSKSLTAKIGRNVFFVDQILHTLAIAIIAYLFVTGGNSLRIHNVFAEILKTTGLPAVSILKWAVVLLSVHKPVNIAISRLLLIYKPEKRKDENAADDKKAGRLVGTLERTIIVILIFIEQYSAIGLVLTAKSIARYDKISKDPAFSEYYLIGTLLSTLAVVAISLLL